MNKPMLTAMHESLAEVNAAAQAGDADTAMYGLLDAFNAMARHVAQVSWALLHDDPDRDEHMEEAEDRSRLQRAQDADHRQALSGVSGTG